MSRLWSHDHTAALFFVVPDHWCVVRCLELVHGVRVVALRVVVGAVPILVLVRDLFALEGRRTVLFAVVCAKTVDEHVLYLWADVSQAALPTAGLGPLTFEVGQGYGLGAGGVAHTGRWGRLTVIELIWVWLDTGRRRFTAAVLLPATCHLLLRHWPGYCRFVGFCLGGGAGPLRAPTRGRLGFRLLSHMTLCWGRVRFTWPLTLGLPLPRRFGCRSVSRRCFVGCLCLCCLWLVVCRCRWWGCFGRCCWWFRRLRWMFGWIWFFFIYYDLDIINVCCRAILFIFLLQNQRTCTSNGLQKENYIPKNLMNDHALINHS